MEITQLIRSKNAGPFSLTFDFMFDSYETYARVRDSGVITKGLIARLYGTAESEVEIFNVDAARGIKVTIPRPVAQGNPVDSDQYGCQQFRPLAELEIPD
jgi:hypothetical protein